MNKYVKVEKENFDSNIFNINFDLKNFVDSQAKIALKYQTEDELLYNSIGSKGFINNYDRYLLHCIEEISEVRDAIIRNKDMDEIREEMVDVLMYLGTMTSIIQMNMEDFEMRTKDEIKIEQLVYTNHFNKNVLFDNERNPVITGKVPVTFDLRLMDVVQYLIEERRLFPQRKWHKPSVNDSELQFKYKLSTLYNSNISCMKIIISLLMEDRNCTERFINELINRKWSLVISLPIPE